MGERKWSKKTDKIEVRLSPETKQAFHKTCEQQGESASGVLRRLIEEYVTRFHQPVIARPMEAIRRTPWWARMGAIAGVGAVAAGVLLLPSSAQTLREKQFVNIDDNRDGRFDAKDYLAHVMPSKEDDVSESTEGLRQFFLDRFESMDANADTLITRAEYEVYEVQRATNLFGSLDASADGAIDFEEFVSPPDQAVRASISGMASGTAFRQGSTPEEFDTEAGVRWIMGLTNETPSAAKARLGQLFRDFDANDDGRIVLEEFLAR